MECLKFRTFLIEEMISLRNKLLNKYSLQEATSTDSFLLYL